MRTITLIITLISINFAMELGNTTQVVIPLKKNVPVYKNQTRELHEKPIYKMNINDRYLIIESINDYVKVKNNDSEIGWVEKRLVKKVKASSAHIFNHELIQSYIDDPMPIHIEGDKDSYDTLIIEGRSFADNIRENVDRETIARMKY